MNKPNAFLKATVLLCSVLLLSAFVCYRAGAFDRFLKNSAPTADSAVDALPQDNLSDDSTSESYYDLPPPPPGSVTGAEPPKSSDAARTIISSSKSIILPDGKGIVTVTRVAPNTAQAQPPAPPAPKATERERSMLPGPKSFAPIILPPSINNAPATPPPSPNQSTKPSR